MYYKIVGIAVFLTIHCAERSLPLTHHSESESSSEDIIEGLKKQLLTTQIELSLARAREEKDQEKLHAALATILKQNSRFRKTTQILLYKALTVPQYGTPQEHENLIIDRSCAICKEILSKKNSADNPAEVHRKKIVMAMECAHCFCVPCHTQWEQSRHYRNNCAACNQPETSFSIFTINCD